MPRPFIEAAVVRMNLRRSTGVLGGLAVSGNAADVHNVPGCGVVPFCPVGNLPGIHLCVLVVVHQAFHLSVQVYHVGIADLLPPAATLAHRVGVPVADVRRLTSRPSGVAVQCNTKRFNCAMTYAPCFGWVIVIWAVLPLLDCKVNVRVPLFCSPSLASAEMVTVLPFLLTLKPSGAAPTVYAPLAVTVTSLLPPSAGIVTVVGSAVMLPSDDAW